MSASGVLCRCDGSGDAEGVGVGKGGGNSGAADERLLREGAALFLFLGEAFFVGETGSGGIVLSSGSKICEGSMPSPVFARRLRAALRGVGGTSAVVFRLDDFLGLRFGAGVKSSPLSSWVFCGTFSCSSSDASTMTLRRVAARREGRVGEIVAIAVLVV